MLEVITIIIGVTVIALSKKMIVYVSSIPANGEHKTLSHFEMKIKKHKRTCKQFVNNK